jgi:hypothetical protein
MTRFRCCLAVSLLAIAGCGELLLEPPNRKDPGTVIVHVRDTSGAAVAGAWVYIELPNSIGSTFWEGTATNGQGNVTHRVIPAGRRMLEVKPPASFAADEPRQEVEVIKDRTVTAQFTLRRVL